MTTTDTTNCDPSPAPDQAERHSDDPAAEGSSAAFGRAGGAIPGHGVGGSADPDGGVAGAPAGRVGGAVAGRGVRESADPDGGVAGAAAGRAGGAVAGRGVGESVERSAAGSDDGEAGAAVGRIGGAVPGYGVEKRGERGAAGSGFAAGDDIDDDEGWQALAEAELGRRLTPAELATAEWLLPEEALGLLFPSLSDAARQEALWALACC